MQYWLIKSDPETYSFADLQRERQTAWDGVRNYQARNNLAAMQVGDLCLVYHSQTNPGVVGTAEVVRPAYPDPKSDDPRWVNVDVRAGKALTRSVSLGELRKHPLLSQMGVVRQGRLSVSPVTAAEWEAVMELAGEPPR
ncbi:MAG: EVE domain-containing protein [Candidatus Handelsmanbacteria bacterium]|nr:EVE domain-containing protein [Candidatus Handelsmanbacteria bacterium]